MLKNLFFLTRTSLRVIISQFHEHEQILSPLLVQLLNTGQTQ